MTDLKQPSEGELVTPKIRLVRPLGAGGMGSVWLADHLALHTQVVVKFIAAELANHKEAIARFEREAAAASQVKSPHVVQILDHGITDEGTPFIVMELLEGRDLGAHLEKFGRMDLTDVGDVVAQLCRALARAHERGIVHRDIKPQNIFLCDAGSGELFVKLLDFGIAKGAAMEKLDENTKTGTLVGSPYYMSPEQLVGTKDIDFRTDLWSVGVVAFETMTGTRAFDGETVGALALRIHNDPLPIPTSRNGGLPASVDDWFARACSRDAAGRFASAKEMADAFGGAVLGQSPKSSPLSTSGNALENSAGGGIALAKTAVDSGPVPSGRGSGATPDPRVLTMSGVSASNRPSSRGRVAFALGAMLVGIAGTMAVVHALRTPKDDATTAPTAPATPTGTALATGPLEHDIPPPPPSSTAQPTSDAPPDSAPIAEPHIPLTHKHPNGSKTSVASATAPPATAAPPPSATVRKGNDDDIR